MDGLATVMQWCVWWWLWAIEHCLARYGFSHTCVHASPILSPN